VPSRFSRFSTSSNPRVQKSDRWRSVRGAPRQLAKEDTRLAQAVAASKAVPDRDTMPRLEVLLEEAHPNMASRGDTLASALTHFSRAAGRISDSDRN
jgi:hypothetical protein